MDRFVVDPVVVEHNQESPNSAIPVVQSRPCRPAPAPLSIPRNDTTCSPHDELVIISSSLQCFLFIYY
jgi:hypothetical protein